MVTRSGNVLVDRHEDEDVPVERGYCFDCGSNPCRCEEYKEKHQEELEAYCPTFEMFLIEEHAKQYQGLDDEMPDDCSEWMGSLDVEDTMKYAEEYGKACFRMGQKVGK